MIKKYSLLSNPETGEKRPAETNVSTAPVASGPISPTISVSYQTEDNKKLYQSTINFFQQNDGSFKDNNGTVFANKQEVNKYISALKSNEKNKNFSISGASSAESNTGGNSGYGPVQSFDAIRAMQGQILDLHNDLSQDKDFATAVENKSKPTTRTGPESQNAAFLNFMLDNYAQGDTTQHDFSKPENAAILDTGKDLKDSSGKVNKGWGASAKGTETTDLRSVMDSIKAVGAHNEKGLSKPDGKWGPYTNKALKNITIFAAAMLNMQKDLNIKSEAYTAGDYQEFIKAMSPFGEDTAYTVNVAEKAKAAPTIANNIKKLRAFFAEFKKSVFENKEYRGLIDQNAKFPTSIGGKAGPKKTVMPIQKPIDVSKIILTDPDNNTKGKFDNFDVYLDKDNQWKYTNPIDSKLKSQKDIDLYYSLTKKDLPGGPKKVFYVNRSLSSVGDSTFDKNNNAGVSLKDLSNLEDFKNFLQSQQFTIDNQPATLNKATLLKAFNKIKDMISKNQIQVST